MSLDPAKLPDAMRTITAWRLEPEAPAKCPQCGASGLVITDCSARPHAEWYRLQCAACGLEHMLNIPMGAGGPGGGY